ncbi:MAG: CRISPR-associated endonuclease Cas1 [Candidatus Sericytochromatia bacterium]|nr:CRISPR-associated endonuclease Cas1 [Candidatus Sericytochromatia bacterium]
MTVLYVTEPGAVVSRTSERLIVSKRKIVLDEVPLDGLDQVVLLGNVQLTHAATRALLEQGTDIALLTGGGRFLGRIGRGRGRNIPLRRAQFRKLEDEQIVLDLARRFIRGKLHHLRVHLGRAQRNRPESELARAIAMIRRAEERLPEVSRYEQVLGLEGTASAAYFGVFGSLLRAPGMVFTERRRRPPPDPVNVLLSFGYTLLGNLMQSHIETVGLDPFLGALHKPEYGRPSLALDLIEEFRPIIVDMAVVRAVNTRTIVPADFHHEERADVVEDLWEDEERQDEGVVPPQRIVFGALGVRKWLAAYERRLNERTRYGADGHQLTYRQIMREQVHALARSLEDGSPYVPFRLEA